MANDNSNQDPKNGRFTEGNTAAANRKSDDANQKSEDIVVTIRRALEAALHDPNSSVPEKSNAARALMTLVDRFGPDKDNLSTEEAERKEQLDLLDHATLIEMEAYRKTYTRQAEIYNAIRARLGKKQLIDEFSTPLRSPWDMVLSILQDDDPGELPLVTEFLQQQGMLDIFITEVKPSIERSVTTHITEWLTRSRLMNQFLDFLDSRRVPSGTSSEVAE